MSQNTIFHGKERAVFVSAILLGVSFSLLGQALYDILKTTLNNVLPSSYSNWVILISAAIPASFFFYLGIGQLRKVKESPTIGQS